MSSGSTLVDQSPYAAKATPSSLSAATKEDTPFQQFIHKFHKKEIPRATPSALFVPEEKEEGHYGDIGKSQLASQLLDERKGVGSSGHMLDGASTEPPKHPALNIADLPRETLPGSDQLAFVDIQQNLFGADARIPRQVFFSTSPDPTAGNPQINVEKLPDLDLNTVPPTVEDSANLDGVFDSFQEETETYYKGDVYASKIGVNSDYDIIFTPIHFMLSIEPQINDCADHKFHGHSIVSKHSLCFPSLPLE